MGVSENFHCQVTPISRGRGRSSVAAAAYQAGATLHDERTDLTYDYTRKRGILGSQMLLPAGLSAPGAELTREKLWNLAERTDTRSNSCTARDFEISVPDILTMAQRHDLGLRLGQYLADFRRGAADVCWHDRRKDSKTNNYHVHILCTTREIAQSEDGKMILGGKCVQELSGSDRHKLGLRGRAVELKQLRADICGIINQSLAAAGRPERMSSLSYEERGINKLPTRHLGPRDAGLERRGIRTETGDYNRWVRERNRQVEEIDKEIAQAEAELSSLRLLATLEKAEEEKRLAIAEAEARRMDELEILALEAHDLMRAEAWAVARAEVVAAAEAVDLQEAHPDEPVPFRIPAAEEERSGSVSSSGAWFTPAPYIRVIIRLTRKAEITAQVVNDSRSSDDERRAARQRVFSLAQRASARVSAYYDILPDDFLTWFDQWETKAKAFLTATRPGADQPDPDPPAQKWKGPPLG